jgi:hypothetical protein
MFDRLNILWFELKARTSLGIIGLDSRVMLCVMYKFVVPQLQKPWLQTTNSGGDFL